ncbi:MAG TPA: hypothetical protein VMV40_09605 [Acidiferrobacter sp.]|nr:hypothetical protein [Acidiferrobacter sp.]
MDEKSEEKESAGASASGPGRWLGVLVSILTTCAYQRYGETIIALKNEKRRLARFAFWAACLGFFLVGGVLFLSVGVIVFFWDRDRLMAVAGVILFYWLLAGLSAWRLHRTAKRRGRLL